MLYSHRSPANMGHTWALTCKLILAQVVLHGQLWVKYSFGFHMANVMTTIRKPQVDIDLTYVGRGMTTITKPQVDIDGTYIGTGMTSITKPQVDIDVTYVGT